jgi:hypothetical protein
VALRDNREQLSNQSPTAAKAARLAATVDHQSPWPAIIVVGASLGSLSTAVASNRHAN